MPISGRQFCRLLEKNGWNQARIRGSHHVYVKEGKKNVVTVPVHANKSMKKGTLARLEKISGVKAR